MRGTLQTQLMAALPALCCPTASTRSCGGTRPYTRLLLAPSRFEQNLESMCINSHQRTVSRSSNQGSHYIAMGQSPV